jgi:hypothetical protein
VRRNKTDNCDTGKSSDSLAQNTRNSGLFNRVSVTSSFCIHPSSFKKWRVAAVPLTGQSNFLPQARQVRGRWPEVGDVVMAGNF